jgi:hypothetical protein
MEECKMNKPVSVWKYTHNEGGSLELNLYYRGNITIKRDGVEIPLTDAPNIEEAKIKLEQFGWKQDMALDELLNPNPTPAGNPYASPMLQAGATDFSNVTPQHPISHPTNSPTKVMEKAIEQNVPLSIQEKVDDYIQLHKQSTELKNQLEKLKKEIRAHMEANNIKQLDGSEEHAVALIDKNASNSTAEYSSYNFEDIEDLLDDVDLAKVTEERVVTSRLESLMKSGDLAPNKVKALKEKKIANAGTPQFSIKK